MRYRNTSHPILYEVNTRVWLAEMSRRAGRPLTLADVPEGEIDRIADLGFDLVWLMGVWRTGAVGQEIARTEPGLQEEYRRALQDLSDRDIVGSPYAVMGYTVSPALGGDDALAALRDRLARRGLGLVLDLVPNHTARDHPWIRSHPEYYVTRKDRPEGGGGYFLAETDHGPRWIAHGKDPYFPPWTDTAQLDYRNQQTCDAVTDTMRHVARRCDGIRCDMAMLILDHVFRRTWGDPQDGEPDAGEFWPRAIARVRREHPGFIFMAEAYWDLESVLQALGFDYTYDKVLYDRLVHDPAQTVRGHLGADLDYQRRSLRFIENHDEPRASARFPWDRHRAAAVIASTVPGMVLFHDGQIDGLKIRVPVQLVRRPGEPACEEVKAFYERLLSALRHPVFRGGSWRALPIRAAWEGNPTWDQFVAHRWDGGAAGARLVAVNFGPHQGQCYVAVDLGWIEGRKVRLRDLIGDAGYKRDGSELRARGMYLDMPPYSAHIFDLTTEDPGAA